MAHMIIFAMMIITTTADTPNATYFGFTPPLEESATKYHQEIKLNDDSNS